MLFSLRCRSVRSLSLALCSLSLPLSLYTSVLPLLFHSILADRVLFLPWCCSAKTKLQAGGAVALAGAGLLGFQHMDIWFNLDFAGVSLLAVGGGLAYSTTLNKKDNDEEPAPRKFEFTKLNDESRLEATTLHPPP